jgi:hypothetical protein
LFLTKGDVDDLIDGLIDVGKDIAEGWDDVKDFAEGVPHAFEDAYADTKKEASKLYGEGV